MVEKLNSYVYTYDEREKDTELYQKRIFELENTKEKYEKDLDDVNQLYLSDVMKSEEEIKRLER